MMELWWKKTSGTNFPVNVLASLKAPWCWKQIRQLLLVFLVLNHNYLTEKGHFWHQSETDSKVKEINVKFLFTVLKEVFLIFRIDRKVEIVRYHHFRFFVICLSRSWICVLPVEPIIRRGKLTCKWSYSKTMGKWFDSYVFQETVDSHVFLSLKKCHRKEERPLFRKQECILSVVLGR